MDQNFSFEAIPLEIDPELDPEIFQEEGEWGRRGFQKGRPGAGFTLRRPMPSRARPLPPAGKPRPGPRRPWAVVPTPYPYSVEPAYSTEPAGSEHIRWVQDCLNQASGLRLAVTGFMGPETRSAVRSFQRGQGLRVSGIVGPDTEDALRASCGDLSSDRASEQESFWRVLAGENESRLEEEYLIDGTCKIQITSLSMNSGTNVIDLDNESDWSRVSGRPSGVYIIKSGSKVHYVGQAKDLKGRFLDDRFRVLREFDLDQSALKGRKALLFGVDFEKHNTVKCTVKWKKKTWKAWSQKTVDGKIARDIAEWALIRHYGKGQPRGLPPGNRGKPEDVQIAAGGTLTVTLNTTSIYP